MNHDIQERGAKSPFWRVAILQKARRSDRQGSTTWSWTSDPACEAGVVIIIAKLRIDKDMDARPISKQ